METRTIRDEAQNADIVTHVLGRGPLVLVSHGTGGTPFGYRGLAEHLAGAGFTLALVEHPGNKKGDDALANTAVNLVNRPRHLRLVIDALAPTATDVAVIGHSLGGYTALAIAGGAPMALPEQSPDGTARPLPVEADRRVHKVVLLAPAVPWFMAPGALDGVHADILALIGEADTVAPPYFSEPILRAAPRADVRVVPNAGHFAWFWPVPPPLMAARALPAIDPPGFDRAAYQPQLHADVAAFLRATSS